MSRVKTAKIFFMNSWTKITKSSFSEIAKKFQKTRARRNHQNLENTEKINLTLLSFYLIFSNFKEIAPKVTLIKNIFLIRFTCTRFKLRILSILDFVVKTVTHACFYITIFEFLEIAKFLLF